MAWQNFFSEQLYHFTFRPEKSEDSTFPCHIQHLLFSTLWIRVFSNCEVIPPCERIYLMNTNAQQFSMYLLNIYMYLFLGEIVIKTVCTHFKVELVILLCNCSLYILVDHQYIWYLDTWTNLKPETIISRNTLEKLKLFKIENFKINSQSRNHEH